MNLGGGKVIWPEKDCHFVKKYLRRQKEILLVSKKGIYNRQKEIFDCQKDMYEWQNEVFNRLR